MTEYLTRRLLERVIADGFDDSCLDTPDDEMDFYSHTTTIPIRVRCSGCSALVINSVPTHERGCPNARRAQYRREQEARDEEEGGGEYA